jgi:hypothetical protein
MSWLARIGAFIIAFHVVSAFAQDGLETGVDIFAPGLVAPTEDFGAPAPPQNVAPIPYAPTEEIKPILAPTGEEHAVALEARLVEGGAALSDGLIWRIFSARPGSDGTLPLVATGRGGSASIKLSTGDYLVHAAFGRAGATKRFTVAGDGQTESLVLNAGGLILNAVVGDDAPVSPDRLSFEVLQENDAGDLVTVVPKAAPGRVLRLPSGTYHVISRYGNVNAVVRADIEVTAGKLTEATMRHTGAQVTLKLVSAEGGEAIANTSWTVFTQAGDMVRESVGAFPSIILAEGNYSAVAKHQNDVYSRDFTVESGVDRDIEVRLSDLVPPHVGQPPDMRDGPRPAAGSAAGVPVVRATPKPSATQPAEASIPADVELDTDADLSAGAAAPADEGVDPSLATPDGTDSD